MREGWLLPWLLSTAVGVWAGGGWQGRVRGRGSPHWPCLGCWFPACPGRALGSHHGLGLAGQGLGAGVLLGLLGAWTLSEQGQKMKVQLGIMK